jgi:hypothetical protein
MHSHHIVLALAEARIADRREATSHGTATKPPRRHPRAQALLAPAATVALAALAPTSALAQPPHDAATATARAPRGSDMSPNQIDARDHGAAVRSINLHQLARDTSTVTPPGQPAPVAVVRVTRVPGGGFDWLDASIGAGLTAALLLGATGLASARRRPTHPAH